MSRAKLIQKICDRARKTRIVFADSETTDDVFNAGIGPYHGHTWMWRPHGKPRRCAGARVFGVSLCSDAWDTCFVRCDDPLFTEIRRVLANRHITKVWHNYPYDKIMCDVSGIRVRGPFEDTLLAARIWDDSKPHGLKPLHSLLTGEPADDEADLKADLRKKKAAHTRAGFPKGYVNYSFADPALIDRYACGDVYKTGVLYLFLKEQIRYAWHLYELDKQMARIAVRMTHRGIAFNLPKARRVLQRSARKEAQMITTLTDTATSVGVSDFAPSKNGKVAELLIATGVPGFLLSKGGKPCTDAACLTALPSTGIKNKHATQVLQYRKLHKLNATYLTPLVRCARYYDSAVHAQWNVGGARTGRFSSSAPNLQNITRKDTQHAEDDKASLRALFIPRPGYVALYIDFSQIELRYLAALTQDEAMLRAYRTGSDLHSLTAERVGIPRQRAKTINFAIVYGIGIGELAMSLGASFAEAHALMNGWYGAYPSVEVKQDALRKRLHYDGYVEGFMGRRYYYPAAAPHKSINAVIQGDCSIILKCAMRNVHRYLKAKVREAQLLGCYHDELHIEFPGSKLSKRHIRAICLAMEDIPEFTAHGVKLVVEPSIVRHNWAEKEEVKDWR